MYVHNIVYYTLFFIAFLAKIFSLSVQTDGHFLLEDCLSECRVLYGMRLIYISTYVRTYTDMKKKKKKKKTKGTCVEGGGGSRPLPHISLPENMNDAAS